ncbi:unnamed protein product [Phaedon cochleariae]|uniref:Calcyclin-binding protein n=1 Tax=Phaedon cochleariae TaxID=80249 RepID=A0A9P0DB44_PHACE|nr:unnamed protein product [Phaedon cochleariae]
MAEKIQELRKDIAELESLEKHSTRQKVKDILSIEIRKLISEIVRLEEEGRTNPVSADAPSISSKTSNKVHGVQVKLNNYGWDQSNKFIKFYVTLKDVQTIAPENIKCEFTSKSLELVVENMESKNYILKINHLLKTIDPSQSDWKVKKDMVIINAAKSSPDHWSHVTEWEKKASDKKLPNLDTDKSDPSDGLMSLMKNMYESGDDEMKRTIAKAWTESQGKQHFG